MVIKSVAALVALMMVDTAFCMGIIHGVAELGQYAGVYDYEPVWQHSLFAALAYKVVRILL